MQDTVIIIPSRLAATRLPNKPLLKIKGKEMILHVWERAVATGAGEVYVACGDAQIFDLISAHGGKAIMTDPDLPSGTDRVYQALLKIEHHLQFYNIINLQGDMPNFHPEIIDATLNILRHSECDIATIAAACTYGEALKESVVKPVIGLVNNFGIAKALYFSRNLVPFNAAQYYYHIGIYGFKQEALAKFISLPHSPLENFEKLEQLRALEHGMNINISIIDHPPFSVDTPEDLEMANLIM